MGYAVYEDRDARDRGVDRWAGYGVPAVCDWPDCEAAIDRGLAYKCEEHLTYFEWPDGREEENVDEGCGLYFCSEHLYKAELHGGVEPKPDTREWVEWMLTDESWEQWRTENPDRVASMRVVEA